MLFTQLLAGLTLLGAAAAAPADHDKELLEKVRRQYPVRACSHDTGGLHVLAAGGANSNDPKALGFLSALSNSILDAIPGSTNVSIPYDKVVPLSPNSIPDGVKTFRAYVQHYHESCPTTKMAVIGYSSGAVLVMNGLCEGAINPSLADRIIVGTVVYGDETRVAGQSYDLGTGPECNGRSPRQDPAGCGPFANSLQSYCDEGDPQCCVPGTDPNIHFVYPSKYDSAATQFIVDAFNKNGGA